MQKQFVTYRIALKLKELGFDEECLAYITPMKSWMIEDYSGKPSSWLRYNVGDYMYIKTVSDPFGDNLHRDKSFVKNSTFTKAIKNIALPLWQQVIDWFREKHDIHISIPNYYDGWSIDIRGFKQNINLEYHSEPGICLENYYETREQAILKVIELCQKEK